MKEVNMYLNNLYRNDFSELTIENYKRQLSRWFEYKNIKNIEDLKMVSSIDLENYDLELKNSGLSSNTRNTYVKPIGLFYKYLIAHDLVEKNPCQNLKIKTKNKQETQWMDIEDTKIFLSHCKKLRDVAMFSLVCDTGMRFLEFSNIKIKEIIVNVEDNTYLVEVLGKGNKLRTLGFSKITYDRIVDYIKNERPKCDNDILFVTKHGQPLENRAINYSLKSILKKANLPELSVHKLRHGFCSAMINKGYDIKSTQMAMGHASINTTLSIYTHGKSNKVAKNMSQINLYD